MVDRSGSDLCKQNEIEIERFEGGLARFGSPWWTCWAQIRAEKTKSKLKDCKSLEVIWIVMVDM